MVLIFFSATNNENKPKSQFIGRVDELQRLKRGGETRDLISKFFFSFCIFSPFFIKKDCVFGGLFASGRKDDGRGDRSEGETEAESRLFDAVTERKEANDEFAKSVRHLHTSGEASRRR